MTKEFKVPAGLKYTKLDEWIKLEGNVITMGITDFAQDQMLTINAVLEFPKIGTTVEALLESEHELTIETAGKTSTRYIPGKTVATIDSEKAVFFAYSPIKGKIVEVNETLSGITEIPGVTDFGAGAVVNTNPYGSWFVKIEVIDPTPLENLLDAKAYQKFVRGE